MRKIFTALLATLAFAVVAQPALADNPSSSHWKSYEWAFGSEHTNCQSPYSFGVYKYAGAWGWFVDGCTTKAAVCKLAKCWYRSVTEITMLDKALWWPRTQNSRTRVFSSSGSQLSYVDDSCEANLQGPNRLVRGKRFFEFMNKYYLPHAHVLQLVPGAGHGAGEMYSKPEARGVLFPALPLGNKR